MIATIVLGLDGNFSIVGTLDGVLRRAELADGMLSIDQELLDLAEQMDTSSPTYPALNGSFGTDLTSTIMAIVRSLDTTTSMSFGLDAADPHPAD